MKKIIAITIVVLLLTSCVTVTSPPNPQGGPKVVQSAPMKTVMRPAPPRIRL